MPRVFKEFRRIIDTKACGCARDMREILHLELIGACLIMFNEFEFDGPTFPSRLQECPPSAIYQH